MERKRTGLILAYDRNTFTSADRLLLKNLVPYAQVVKLGHKAMTAELTGATHKGASVATAVRNFLQDPKEFEIPTPIMWDIKLNDTGDTVEAALKNIVQYPGVKFVTVHASVTTDTLIRAAAVCKKASVTLVVVTVLSDMEEADCRTSFGDMIERVFLRFARKAFNNHIETIVCSPHELKYLKEARLWAHMATIVPGVRSEGVSLNGQKRVMTPREAMAAGADYIVVGREVFLAKKPLVEIQRISEILDRA